MNNDTEDEVLSEFPVDAQGSFFLLRSAVWARRVAISGLIFCTLGFILLLYSILNTTYFDIDTILQPLRSIAVLAVAVIAMFYLLRFSRHMKTASEKQLQQEAEEAFSALCSYFRLIGIAATVSWSLYVLISFLS